MSNGFEFFANNRLTESYINQYISVSETEPTNEPLSLSEVKNYLKVDISEDDALITVLISGVRKAIENELGGLVLVQRTITQKQTGGLERLELLRQPVISVSNLTFAEGFSDAPASISNSDYRLSGNDLFHVNNFFKKGRNADGYVITYTAGLVADTTASASNIYETIKVVMLRLIAYLYENRQEFVNGYNEGGWSINYNFGEQKALLKLLMPYHSGKGLI